MADDDTFDIDIYGEDEGDAEPTAAPSGPQDDFENLYDEDDLNPSGTTHTYDGAADLAAPSENTTVPAEGHLKPTNSTNSSKTPKPSASPTQGVKRKAPSDEVDETRTKPPTTSTPAQPDSRPLDPGATNAIRLAELQWWATEEELRGFCASAKTESELRDLSFGEHKINGKSRGEAYLEFSSPQAATATKREIEKIGREAASATGGARKPPVTVFYAPSFDPFRNASGAAVGAKKDHNGNGTAGADLELVEARTTISTIAGTSAEAVVGLGDAAAAAAAASTIIATTCAVVASNKAAGACTVVWETWVAWAGLAAAQIR